MHHHTMLRPVAALVFGALALGALSACGTTEPVSAARVAATSRIPASEPVPTSTPAAEPPAPAPPRTAAPPASSTPTTTTSVSSTSDSDTVRLAVVTDPKLGAIVVDGAGKTLYRLDGDTARPPKSNCANDCAKRFPPLLVPAGTTVDVEGIDDKLVGTLVRADRTTQVTLAGRPLYGFAADTAPGDTLGHGLAGAFASTPTGAKAAARSA